MHESNIDTSEKRFTVISLAKLIDFRCAVPIAQ
jgi:hypothetical protein